MQTLFLRKGLSGHTMAVIFIHDLIPTVLSAVLPDTSGFSVIDANRKAACCQGRFRCWLASPGQCVMKDDLQTVGAQIGTCKKVIHPLRYQNRPTLTVCFYGAVTDFERETAMRLVEANRVNRGFSSVQVYFAEKPELMAEVIKSR